MLSASVHRNSFNKTQNYFGYKTKSVGNEPSMINNLTKTNHDKYKAKIASLSKKIETVKPSRHKISFASKVAKAGGKEVLLTRQPPPKTGLTT